MGIRCKSETIPVAVNPFHRRRNYFLKTTATVTVPVIYGTPGKAQKKWESQKICHE